ncbi:MAG: aminodeoxychorismate/anthranilate synthase component II [Cyanobacteria bacterium]|nr:aminodeoxychorismate/anthranilate synthase component II [Cyanobacteriota bacterium]
MTRALWLIDNYDSFTYNLYQALQVSSPVPVKVVRHDEIDFVTLARSNPMGIVLSPGPGHPENPNDLGVCADILTCREMIECPILGVCLGHQALCAVLGARIVPASQIMHGKTSTARRVASVPSRLLFSLPESFEVMRYHSWTVDPASLPSSLQITAMACDDEAVMAVEHIDKPWFGVQFHPESIATALGQQCLDAFIDIALQQNRRQRRLKEPQLQ